MVQLVQLRWNARYSFLLSQLCIGKFTSENSCYDQSCQYGDCEGSRCVDFRWQLRHQFGLLHLIGAQTNWHAVYHIKGNSGVTAPADAEWCIACGALDINGKIAGFSSRGPTFDGRIKPDGRTLYDACLLWSSLNISSWQTVSALGMKVWYAKASTGSRYESGGGTSYATPLGIAYSHFLFSSSYLVQ